jgi:hypothetical protein
MPTQNANSGKRSLLKENIAFQILIPVVILIAVVISLSGYLVSKKLRVITGTALRRSSMPAQKGSFDRSRLSMTS